MLPIQIISLQIFSAQRVKPVTYRDKTVPHLTLLQRLAWYYFTANKIFPSKLACYLESGWSKVCE